MRGEEEAMHRLRDGTRAAFGPVEMAFLAYADAQKTMGDADSLDGALAAAVDIVAAGQDTHAASLRAKESLRALLAAVIDDYGCVGVRGAHFEAGTAARPGRAVVEDFNALPERYKETRPRLDALRADLSAGERVPGARLEHGNRERVLWLRKLPASYLPARGGDVR